MNVRSAGFGTIITLVFTLFLFGCSHKVDERLIGSEECNPPCVLGIQPGVTETTKTVQLLEDLETNSVGKLTILDSGIIRWRASNTNYYFYPDGNLIKEISLSPEATTLQDIITLFGEPAYLHLGKIRDGGFFVSVFYPEKGLCFVVGGDKAGFLIEPDMPVVKADFIEPTNIATMVKSLYGKEAVEDALAEIQSWHGYGKLFP